MVSAGTVRSASAYLLHTSSATSQLEPVHLRTVPTRAWPRSHRILVRTRSSSSPLNPNNPRENRVDPAFVSNQPSSKITFPRMSRHCSRAVRHCHRRRSRSFVPFEPVPRQLSPRAHRYSTCLVRGVAGRHWAPRHAGRKGAGRAGTEGQGALHADTRTRAHSDCREQ